MGVLRSRGPRILENARLLRRLRLGKAPVRQGRLAQLGEHLPYTQRVAGSSPAPPIPTGTEREDWMASSSKRQTTMAKLAREQAVREKRARRLEKKEDKKQAAVDALTADAEGAVEGEDDETDTSDATAVAD